MDLNLNESQSILRKSAREFLAGECPPSLVKAMEADAVGYPPALWRRMVEMGWCGIAIPEEYGGHGGTMLDLLVLLQETGRAALPGPFFSSAVLGGLVLLEGAGAAQKRALLPRLCRGELLVSLALSEPGVDFGLEHLSTAAASRGGEHTVSGTKLFVPDAHVAELLLCVAAQAGGLGVLAVNAKSPGVTLAPLATRLRDKQFEVVFENARAEFALGEAGSARAWLERALDKAMLARCAEMVGAGQKALEMSVEYAKVRVQFGKPIGTLQAVQHHCANAATAVETAELMTYRAGWLLDQGIPCRRDILRAKAWTNEASKRAAALCHQVHGGMGFTREYDLYLYTGRMTAFAQTLGATGWCHEQIARDIGLGKAA